MADWFALAGEAPLDLLPAGANLLDSLLHRPLRAACLLRLVPDLMIVPARR
jgi:hypothetical protein